LRTLLSGGHSVIALSRKLCRPPQFLEAGDPRNHGEFFVRCFAVGDRQEPHPATRASRNEPEPARLRLERRPSLKKEKGPAPRKARDLTSRCMESRRLAARRVQSRGPSLVVRPISGQILTPLTITRSTNRGGTWIWRFPPTRRRAPLIAGIILGRPNPKRLRAAAPLSTGPKIAPSPRVAPIVGSSPAARVPLPPREPGQSNWRVSGNRAARLRARFFEDSVS